jgi:hypothetical protein
MKDIKDNRDCFLIVRVTKEEKQKVLLDAQDSKSPSIYIRHRLGLKK